VALFSGGLAVWPWRGDRGNGGLFRHAVGRSLRDSLLKPATIVLLLMGGLLGSPVPAAAQGGASCLYECDSKCYGMSGPYCKSQCMAECNSRGSGGAPVRQSYGSVYVTYNGSGDYGYSYEFDDQYGAMAEAEKQCKADGGGAPCARLLVFANKCASVVYAKRGDDIVDISGSAEPRQADADAQGLALCKRANPTASCEVVERFCSK
jgi:hypothetical protein